MKTIHLLSCPLEPHFHFYNCCPIKCLYNSTRCKYNCIQLGSSQLSENKSLSLSEILFYKADLIPDTELNIRVLNAMKKEATTRIQLLYTFNFYLEFLRQNYLDLRLTLSNSNFYTGNGSRIKNLLESYPYNISLLKITVEDLVLIFTESYFDEFRRSKKLSSEIDYFDVVCVRGNKLNKVRKVLQKYLKRKGIEHEFCRPFT